MEPRSPLSLYTDDTDVGMDHPLWMAKTQAAMDADMAYRAGVPLDESLRAIPERIRFLFGEDVPVTLVTATVSLTYATLMALGGED
ncbi:MAG: hypothetical protein WCK28_06050 [Burkholderiales bacterium]|jgi:hypothetical protein